MHRLNGENQRGSFNGSWLPHAIIIPVSLLGLYLTSLYNFVLFHSLVECAGVVISGAIFVVAINTSQINKNSYLLLLGIGFFFVAVLDILHTLAYRGMNVFHFNNADLATQLWISSRYIQAATMLIAPLAITRVFKAYTVFLLYAAVVAALLVAMFTGVFPVCLDPETGLTPFKIASEFVICLILLAAVYLHYKIKNFFNPFVLRLIIASIVATVAAEMSFTLYHDVYDFMNTVGHFLKVISFYLLYVAILEMGLKNPYTLLFNTLADSEEKYRKTFESISDSITVTRVSDGRYFYVNEGFSNVTGYTPEEVLGRTPADIDLYATPEDRERFIGILRKYGQAVDVEVPFRRKNGSIIYTEFSARPIEYGGERCLVAQAKDITERRKAQLALRESNDLHKSMIANISDVIAIINQDTKIRYKSPNVEKWFGWRPEDLLGKEAWVTVHPDDLPRIKGEYLAVAANDRSVRTMEYRYRCKDGSYRPIQLTAANLLSDPVVNGFLVNYHDITGRKAAEEALERRLVSLTQPLDDSGVIDFEDLFNLNDIQQLQDQFANAFGLASLITRFDGVPITKPSNFCRLCNMVRATDNGLMNCLRSDEVLGRLNPDGPIVQVCQSGGLWDAGAAITVGGKHIANWLVGQVRNEAQSEERMIEYARRIGVDEREFIEAFREIPEMSLAQFERIAQVLFTLSKLLSTLAYQNVQQARFITERKRAADEKARIEGQLRQAQKMEAIGTLAGGIAHDFNNILSAIIGYCELAIGDAKTGASKPEHMEQIMTAGLRAKDLVTQILTFSRKVDADLRPVDLNGIIEQTGKMLERTIPRMVTIEYHSDPGLSLVNANPGQLSQVIMNLCTNANDAMPEGGRLTIETENVTLDEAYSAKHAEATAGSYVMLTVSDTGHGMDQRTQEKIFDPFFTSKDVGKGTGLGLAMVYGIVKAHEGFIYCYSEVDRGTTFKVYLPAIRGGTAAAADSGAPVTEVIGGTETILVVDDETAIRDLGQKLLSRAGYEVIVAGTGEDAVEIYNNLGARIDLVILDISMPGMGGHKCLLELLEINPRAKVIISSGYSRNGRIKDTLDAGAAGFIPKPFTRREMLITVRQVLDA